MSLEEATNTWVGQVYHDAMMDSDVQVMRTDDIAVYVRDVDRVGEDEKGDGSPYVWPQWQAAKEAGRFTLTKDPDRPESDVSGSEEDDVDDPSTTDPPETESPDDAESGSEESLNPDDFDQESARSW